MTGFAKWDELEGLRGLSSLHALVRFHAVCVLGDRTLGEAAGRRILPRLADLALHDGRIHHASDLAPQHGVLEKCSHYLEGDVRTGLPGQCA